MSEIRVQKWTPQDAIESLSLPRRDPIALEPVAQRRGVDDLDRPDGHNSGEK